MSYLGNDLVRGGPSRADYTSSNIQCTAQIQPNTISLHLEPLHLFLSQGIFNSGSMGIHYYIFDQNLDLGVARVPCARLRGVARDPLRAPCAGPCAGPCATLRAPCATFRGTSFLRNLKAPAGMTTRRSGLFGGRFLEESGTRWKIWRYSDHPQKRNFNADLSG